MGFGMQRQMLSADLRDDEVCECFKGALHLAATHTYRFHLFRGAIRTFFPIGLRAIRLRYH